MYERHAESSAVVAARPPAVFEFLDDPTRLTAHMEKRSWKMAWGRMVTTLDAKRGRAVGSRIVVEGSVLGIRLYLEEVVTKRQPPTEKQWETVGRPKLLVIGAYGMRFTVTEAPSGASAVTVHIDYDLPTRGFSTVLGRLFGASYARWCTRRMTQEARQAFVAGTPSGYAAAVETTG